jgi:hypothetical protein
VGLKLTDKEIFAREADRYRQMVAVVGNYLGSKVAASSRCMEYALESDCFKTMQARSNLRLQPSTLRKDSLRIDSSLL